MALYSKPFLPLPKQLDLLKTRGLQVADDAAAIECLHRNGYYRLSAYWYPFRKIITDANGNKIHTDDFLPDSHFDHAVELYKFDKKLKLLLLDALERVEIAVRVEVTLTLGVRDPFAHTNPSLLASHFTNDTGPQGHQAWCHKFEQLVARSKETFVKHHKRKYGQLSPLPIWIAIELWDFGLLSYLFSGMTRSDRIDVATRFSILTSI